jgi:hypothetical protein
MAAIPIVLDLTIHIRYEVVDARDPTNLPVFQSDTTPPNILIQTPPFIQEIVERRPRYDGYIPPPPVPNVLFATAAFPPQDHGGLAAEAPPQDHGGLAAEAPPQGQEGLRDAADAPTQGQGGLHAGPDVAQRAEANRVAPKQKAAPRPLNRQSA